MSTQKKSFTLYQNSSIEDRPEQALINDPAAGFI